MILSLRKQYAEGRPDAFDGYLLVSTKESDSGQSTKPTDIPLYLKPYKGGEVPCLQNLKVKNEFMNQIDSLLAVFQRKKLKLKFAETYR